MDRETLQSYVEAQQHKHAAAKNVANILADNRQAQRDALEDIKNKPTAWLKTHLGHLNKRKVSLLEALWNAPNGISGFSNITTQKGDIMKPKCLSRRLDAGSLGTYKLEFHQMPEGYMYTIGHVYQIGETESYELMATAVVRKDASSQPTGRSRSWFMGEIATVSSQVQNMEQICSETGLKIPYASGVEAVA